MAISLEDLTAAALEGSVSPVTLAIGASAVAVALAAGSARPLGRIAATSVLAAERLGRSRLAGLLGAARRGWTSLVDEARAEYDAGRRASERAERSPVVVASASGVVAEPGGVVLAPDAAADPSPSEETGAGRVRDHRGRFVRRSSNGSRPE